MEPHWDIELPRLYKKSKTGAIVVCDIKTAGDNIKVITGQVEGKHVDHWTKCYPKNEGKKNETTSTEQAQIEAKAKHVKKIKGGYVLDPTGEQVVRLPMKVKKYQEQKKNVIFPCWLSPKLNGINGEFRSREKMGGIDLEVFSRGGDTYPFLTHMRSDILEVMEELKTKTLNGEIYKHGMFLQDITSAVKKHNNDTPDLSFHIFDIPDSPEEYSEKVKRLQKIQDRCNVKIITAIPAENHEDIEKYLELCLSGGYEGIIIRNSKAIYEYNIRSSNIFKYKLPSDAEYLIVGYKLDKKGHPVFRCTTGEHEFNVKPKGVDAERLKIAKEADTWVGKWLQIEFEELSKDDKPLKPVGIRLRKCDTDGNPLE
jgi:ATP-dependent DNA ligase